jgi:hypothetical protein
MPRVSISITPRIPGRMPLISARQAVKAGSWDCTLLPPYGKNQRTVPRVWWHFMHRVCLIYSFIHRCVLLELPSTYYFDRRIKSRICHLVLMKRRSKAQCGRAHAHTATHARTVPGQYIYARSRDPVSYCSLMDSNPIDFSSCAGTSRQAGRHFKPPSTLQPFNLAAL